MFTLIATLNSQDSGDIVAAFIADVFVVLLVAFGVGLSLI